MFGVAQALLLYLAALAHGAGETIFSSAFNSFNTFRKSATSNPHEGLLNDTMDFDKEYDFIVVGAGSGGSVVTNRLTEISGWTVLLLEAGMDETFLSDVPFTSVINQITALNWGYRTGKVPGACLGLKDQVSNWPRGKVLGGTSAINFMIHTRGNKLDYDKWEALGNTGWGFKDVLPYFKKTENVQIPEFKQDKKYRGSKGYLNIEQSPFVSELFKPFMTAGLELGYQNNDPNGELNIGFSRAQATMRKGRRCSASKAYLEPIRDRGNLFISKGSRVTKILINPETKQAYGVQFLKDRKRYEVFAKKEVILAAGTMGSAHLLLLSGVGPRKQLESFGIPVMKDSMVGYNLQDHVTFTGNIFLVNDSVTLNEGKITNPGVIFEYIVNRKGPLTLPSGIEGVAFLKSKYASSQNDDYPDLEIILITEALNGDRSGVFNEVFGLNPEFKNLYSGIEDAEAFGLTPILLQPHSRGRMTLRSANPFHWPLFEPNYLQDRRDVDTLIEATKIGFTSNTGLNTVMFISTKSEVEEGETHPLIEKVNSTLDTYRAYYLLSAGLK